MSAGIISSLAAIFDEPTGRFDLIVAAAGLNPARDFRNRDLRGIDFSWSILSGFDFTNSNLRGTNLRAATEIDSTVIFDGCELDEVDRSWLIGQHVTPVIEEEKARLQAFRQKADDIDKVRHSIQWAEKQHALGVMLRRYGQQHGDLVALREAVKRLRDALTVRTKGSDPSNWAESQNSLGVALGALADLTHDKALIEEGIEAHKAALTNWTQAELFFHWALGQRNYATSLAAHARESDDAIALQSAIDLLSDISKNDKSLLASGNLATAYDLQAGLKGDAAYLYQAITLYRAALAENFYRKGEFEYAELSRSLGQSLASVAEIENNPNMYDEAVAVLSDTLESIENSSFPELSAKIKEDLDLVRRARLALGVDHPLEVQTLSSA
jgi:tetratricopeptide (TPR) repeat protein